MILRRQTRVCTTISELLQIAVVEAIVIKLKFEIT